MKTVAVVPGGIWQSSVNFPVAAAPTARNRAANAAIAGLCPLKIADGDGLITIFLNRGRQGRNRCPPGRYRTTR